MAFPVPLSLLFFWSLVRMFVVGLGAHPKSGPSHLKILTLLVSAKTFLPNKIAFRCSKWTLILGWGSSFLGWGSSFNPLQVGDRWFLDTILIILTMSMEFHSMWRKASKHQDKAAKFTWLWMWEFPEMHHWQRHPLSPEMSLWTLLWNLWSNSLVTWTYLDLQHFKMCVINNNLITTL